MRERDSDAVNTVGEPCAGKPLARFDEGLLGRAPSLNQRPTLQGLRRGDARHGAGRGTRGPVRRWREEAREGP